MRRLRFEKWEGLGNDFVVGFSADGWRLEDRESAVALCDRHRGVGADGLLWVSESPWTMRVFNADGSESEMCGNGLRCVARAISERAGQTASRGVVAGGATYETEVLDGGLVRVVLPPATFGRAGEHGALAPVTPVTGGGGGSRVSTGNPHWVFLDPPAPELLAGVGPVLERDVQFADRTNVEWVYRLGDGHYRVAVWERGCGLTQACGTGATAVASLLVELGREPVGRPIRVELPGGALQLTRRPDARMEMVGPARRVFVGEWPAER
jgi:diaminopimelate epimerase